MPKWLLKLAIGSVRDPEETSKTLYYAVTIICCVMFMIAALAMEMIGSFLNQKDSSNTDIVNGDYDVESTKMYQDIQRVYDKFTANMIRKMDKREAEIIADHTTYREVVTMDENGDEVTKQEAVCDVTVVKSWNDFSLSYLFSYINHSTEVKSNIEYQFDDKEIYEICEQICSLKESGPNNNTYTLYTVVVTPEDAAKMFYTDEDIQEMYCVSFELYDDFLSYTSNTYASAGSAIYTDGSGTKVSGNVSEKLKALFPDGVPRTEAEMQKYLTTVSITVRDKDGNLQQKNITVHKALAEDVIAIFKEIADAGFCAYDVGAYVWRAMAASGNQSHHSYGVAIDINPNENYMIKNGKIVAGSCWNPSSNKYSFGPDSVVVRAFQKRGWVWGGSWKSSKDYMHFSYTGY